MIAGRAIDFRFDDVETIASDENAEEEGFEPPVLAYI
jgi:hypothetical protein